MISLNGCALTQSKPIITDQGEQRYSCFNIEDKEALFIDKMREDDKMRAFADHITNHIYDNDREFKCLE